MLEKPAFLIDSTLATETEDMRVDDLFILPLYAVIDDKPHKDFIEMGIEEFYGKMLAGCDVKTSQPAVGDFVAMYEDIRNQGYSEIFVFMLSTGLSGTYNTAVMASEMVEGINIYVIDTRLSSAMGGVVAKDVMEYAKTATTPEEIIDYAEKSFRATKVAAYMSSLAALEKGGRISKVSAVIGNFLKIKPIITFVEDGTFELLAKERVESKAIRRCIDSVMNTDKKIKNVIILHTIETDLRAKMKAEFETLHPEVPYYEYGLSPVLGVHLGNEGTGIFVQYEI